MDTVQIALVAIGLAAIGGGALALVVAIAVLRKRSPTSPARSSRGEVDPTPTMDPAALQSAARPEAQGAAYSSGALSGNSLTPSQLEEEDDDEDQIPTTVLSAGDYADLDEMIAAIDGIDRGERS